MFFLIVGLVLVKCTVLVYSGKLLDERVVFIGGVFLLIFVLYNKVCGGKVLWSELYFVAVDQGFYFVEFGCWVKLFWKLSFD